MNYAVFGADGKVHKSAEQMQREDIDSDRNAADALLQAAADSMTTDNPETTNCALMAIAHAVLALKVEVQRIGDVLDERMQSL